jgi:transcriptional antiterminator RfaH
LNYTASSDTPRWYVVYTKPREEERAESNLRAWGVTTFMPRIKQPGFSRGNARARASVKHLFPRYIFAKFNCDSALHKVNSTRGVCGVVAFGHKPCPVDDIVIETIQSQVREEGFVKLDDDISCGDPVMMRDGPFNSFQGTVDRKTSDRDHVVVLLSSVSYQGRLLINKALVKKTAMDAALDKVA